MKEDVFGPALKERLEHTDTPLSAHELTDEVGCSTQRTYAWIQKNRESGNLIAMGRTTKGGTTWVWKGNPVASKALRQVATAGAQQRVRDGRGSGVVDSVREGGVQVGANLVVVNMRWMQGTVMLTLRTEDGTTLDAQLT